MCYLNDSQCVSDLYISDIPHQSVSTEEASWMSGRATSSSKKKSMICNTLSVGNKSGLKADQPGALTLPAVVKQQNVFSMC